MNTPPSHAGANHSLSQGVAFKLALLGLTCLSSTAYAQGLPTGGQYVSGQGVISSAGHTTTIVQSSQRGIINWQGFSVGKGGVVTFNNGTGATLNRVTGAQLSTILGNLNATGSVYLINPNGVVIAASGKVVTGGSFVASTRDVSNGQFMAGGALVFKGTSAGRVINDGKIVAKAGDVILIGSYVTNNGKIHAGKGTAALAAGSKIVLSQANGPTGVYVAPDTTANGDVTNRGQIKAAAAELAAAGGNVYALAGNQQGIIQATGSKTVAGQVWLTASNGTVTVDNSTISASNADGSGGTVVANGQNVVVGSKAVIVASATRTGQAGGHILVGASAPGGVNLAQTTSVADGASLTATGKGTGAGGDIETSGHTLTLGAAKVNAGQGGSWLLDPQDLTIGSAAATAIDGSLNAGTSVTEQTSASSAPLDGSGAGIVGQNGAGDITIAAPILWNGAATLTLSAYNNVNIDAAITAESGGKLDITTNNAEANGSASLNFNGGNISFTTPGSGTLNINGTPYTLVWGISGVQSLNNNSSGNYALADNIDASGTPADATLVGVFSGTFNGLGNTISNLTINNTTSSILGLFGLLNPDGLITNLGLINENIIGGNAGIVGGLVGQNSGNITDSYATGSVSSAGSMTYLGELVGWNYYSGTITGSYATGAVSATTPSGDIGGLVGKNNGTIITSYATGAVSGTGDNSQVGGLVGQNSDTITNAYAAGAVLGAGNNSQVGGLVGQSNGDITNAYATGTVTARGTNSKVGGLLGSNGGTITDAYAIGAVTAAGDGTVVGGLVGGKNFGTITGGYFDTDTTGVSADTNLMSGVTGLTTLQWLTQGPTVSGSPYGFQNPSAWVAGLPFPVLKALPYLVVTATGSQTYGGSTITGAISSIVDQNGSPENGQISANAVTWVSNASPTDNVGDEYIIGGYGAQATGYQIAYTGTLTINPATLEVFGSKTYDGTSAFGAGDLTAQGVNGQTFSLTSGTGQASGTDVGSYHNVSLSGLILGTSLNGGLASNYILPPSANLAITRAQLTAVISGDPTKTYDGNTAATLNNDDYTINGFVAGQGASVTQAAGTYAGANAGSEMVNTVFQSGSFTANLGTNFSNYILPASASGTGTITPAPLTLTYNADTASSSYGASPAPLSGTVTPSGFVDGQSLSDLGGSAAWSTTATSSSNAGAYGITGSGYTSTNYIITPVQAAANESAYTINPLQLTAAISGDPTKTYDGNTAATLNNDDYTLSGFIAGQGASVTQAAGTYASANTGAEMVSATLGALDFTANSDTNLSNYILPTSASGTGTIKQAQLTITAGNATSTYGISPDVSGAGFTETGLVNGDTISAVTLETEATNESAIGTYIITASAATGAGLNNYNISYLPGILTINPKQPKASLIRVFYPTSGLDTHSLSLIPIIFQEDQAGVESNPNSYSVSTGLPISTNGRQQRLYESQEANHFQINLPPLVVKSVAKGAL